MNAQRKPRGFAAMDRKLVSDIARKGGKAAHTAGTAHEFTSDEARIAGAKGGKATHARKRAAKLAPAGTKSGDVDQGGKMVEVSCSSAAGCEGIVKAGSPEAAEAVGKPFTPKSSKKGAAHDPCDGTPKGPSADEDPDNMGHCGTGGCGSHGG